MADQPQRAQGSAPGSSSDPIQRATDHDSEQVPQHWLLEPGHIHLAANVDRLAGDVELITLLGLNGFIGRDWDYFATELAKYGMAVIGGWLHSGTIFQKVKSRDAAPPVTRPRVTNDQRIELTLLAAELRRHERCGDCRDARTIRAKINAVLDEC